MSPIALSPIIAGMALEPTLATRLVAVNPVEPDPTVLAEAAALIQAGRLVAFPTETVYGLGANALDATAVTRIFTAKERPAYRSRDRPRG